VTRLAIALTCAILATGWQQTAADPYRDIERSELARTFEPQLGAKLDEATPIAIRAALAIGRTKDAAGAPLLRRRLARSSTSPALRAMCAYGLGLLVDLDSLAMLRALARHDPNSAVRYAAIDAVARIVIARPQLATQPVANDTIIVARTDGDPVVRAHAAAQLDAFKSAAIGRTLARSLGQALEAEPDETVRWHLAWAIFRGYARFVDAEVLERALHDRNELVRVEAARAWGRRTGARAAAIVRTALGDPSWRVQYEAREALRRIAKLSPTDHLLAVPPGLHLPPIPAVAPRVAASPAAIASFPADAPPAVDATKPLGTMLDTRRQAGNAASARALAAPDAATIALAPPVVAETAREFGAPAAAPHPRIRIRTTKGELVLRLYPEWAPATVANFLTLAERRYFDGNRWFRIVPDFVVQTGDPGDNGEGDAGYTIPAEENPIEQRSGIIAMGLNYNGNGALRDSAGTQFYITLSPQLHLNRDFSVFGEVERGFDVLAHLIESDRVVAINRISDG